LFFFYAYCLLHARRQIPDAALERAIVALADNNPYMPAVVIDECSSEWRQISGWCIFMPPASFCCVNATDQIFSENNPLNSFDRLFSVQE
jgi:hypothetical protein